MWIYSTIVLNVWFDRFILLAILISTIFLAMADYNHVNNNNDLITQGSLNNTMLLGSELTFTIIFIVRYL